MRARFLIGLFIMTTSALGQDSLYGELERDIDRERGRVIPEAQYEIERVQEPRDLPVVLEIEEEQERRRLLREQEAAQEAAFDAGPLRAEPDLEVQDRTVAVAPITPMTELEQRLATAAEHFARQVQYAAERFAEIENPTAEQRRAFRDVLIDARRRFAAQIEMLIAEPPQQPQEQGEDK